MQLWCVFAIYSFVQHVHFLYRNNTPFRFVEVRFRYTCINNVFVYNILAMWSHGPHKILSWFNVNHHWANISCLLGRHKKDLRGGYRWFRIYSLVVSEYWILIYIALYYHEDIGTELSPNSGLSPTLIEWLQFFFRVHSNMHSHTHYITVVLRCSCKYRCTNAIRSPCVKNTLLSANIVCTSYGIPRRSCVHEPYAVEISRISCGVRSVLRYVQEMSRSLRTEYESFFLTTNRL